MQSVLNAAARLVYGLRKFDHVTPLLRELHWLRVPERITFRLAVLAYRCQHGLAPLYLADELHRVADAGSCYQLHSASTMALIVPTTVCSTIGDRAFPVAAARAWNSLPLLVTSCHRRHFLSFSDLWRRNFSHVLLAKTLADLSFLNRITVDLFLCCNAALQFQD